MKSTSLIPATASIMALLGFATVVQAGSITYVQSGIASGMIGGSTFTNALVRVTATGDTANVVSIIGFALASPVSATVTIPGIGTATITDPSGIFSTVMPVDIDPAHGFPVLPYVVIGTLDHPPSLVDFTGIGVIGTNALLGYDLQTSAGPIMASPGGIGYPTSEFVHTTLGNLSFTSNVVPTGEGSFTATAAPEPSTLLFFGSGIAALAGLSRLRARG